MKEYFRVLKEVSEEGCTVTLTGYEGKVFGWKAIIHNGKVVYANQKSAWTESVVKALDIRAGSGICETACGKFYYEVPQKKKQLVICGGGHVANAVIRMAKILNLSVTVVEDREQFAAEAEDAGATRVICDAFPKGLSLLDFDERTYVLVMTRGHCHDEECLKYLLRCEYGYLGLLGSKKRVKKLRDELANEGYSREKLDAMYTPVGLAIHAQTPAEIAVSILAEIIQIKNTSKDRDAYEKPLADYLFSDAWLNENTKKSPAMLATIIEKHGSAPCGVGTKMIQFADGRILGSVGGGYLEAQVMQRAAMCMQETNADIQAQTITITSEQSAKEGMFCGGTVAIILEHLN